MSYIVQRFADRTEDFPETSSVQRVLSILTDDYAGSEQYVRLNGLLDLTIDGKTATLILNNCVTEDTSITAGSRLYQFYDTCLDNIILSCDPDFNFDCIASIRLDRMINYTSLCYITLTFAYNDRTHEATIGVRNFVVEYGDNDNFDAAFPPVYKYRIGNSTEKRFRIDSNKMLTLRSNSGVSNASFAVRINVEVENTDNYDPLEGTQATYIVYISKDFELLRIEEVSAPSNSEHNYDIYLTTGQGSGTIYGTDYYIVIYDAAVAESSRYGVYITSWTELTVRKFDYVEADLNLSVSKVTSQTPGSMLTRFIIDDGRGYQPDHTFLLMAKCYVQDDYTHESLLDNYIKFECQLAGSHQHSWQAVALKIYSNTITDDEYVGYYSEDDPSYHTVRFVLSCANVYNGAQKRLIPEKYAMYYQVSDNPTPGPEPTPDPEPDPVDPYDEDESIKSTLADDNNDIDYIYNADIQEIVDVVYYKHMTGNALQFTSEDHYIQETKVYVRTREDDVRAAKEEYDREARQNVAYNRIHDRACHCPSLMHDNDDKPAPGGLDPFNPGGSDISR